MKTGRWLTIAVLSFCLVGCGEGRPFQAKYTSRYRVIITYQGKEYILERYGIPAQTPFRYRFEQDGDLDLTINGREYEIDSPYDVDSNKPKKKITNTAKTKTKKTAVKKNNVSRKKSKH